MKILQEINQSLIRSVSNILCNMGFHKWKTPEGDCYGEKYTEYGVRECLRLHCKRIEKLLICKNGKTEWYCPKERISKLINF